MTKDLRMAEQKLAGATLDDDPVLRRHDKCTIRAAGPERIGMNMHRAQSRGSNSLLSGVTRHSDPGDGDGAVIRGENTVTRTQRLDLAPARWCRNLCPHAKAVGRRRGVDILKGNGAAADSVHLGERRRWLTNNVEILAHRSADRHSQKKHRSPDKGRRHLRVAGQSAGKHHGKIVGGAIDYDLGIRVGQPTIVFDIQVTGTVVVGKGKFRGRRLISPDGVQGRIVGCDRVLSSPYSKRPHCPISRSTILCSNKTSTAPCCQHRDR